MFSCTKSKRLDLYQLVCSSTAFAVNQVRIAYMLFFRMSVAYSKWLPQTARPTSHRWPNAAEERVISLQIYKRFFKPCAFEFIKKQTIKIKINTLCVGSGLSSMSSSRFPDMALFISGPASCNVRKPAC